MFTGLVECVGEVLSISKASAGTWVLRISAPKIAPEVKLGESVSVSGACLTVVSAARNCFEAEMMEETVRATRLGALGAGDRVNLERALRFDSRLDGHLVAGHVDEVGKVLRIEGEELAKKFWFSVSSILAPLVAPKGSIAIDGVSLTVIDAQEGEFSVGLIPTTLRDTTVGSLRRGDEVNIEADMVARYLARILSQGAPASGQKGVTWETLSLNGWV